VTVLPTPDRDSAPWWDALGHHELTLQRCDDCGALRWPPRELCNRCGSLNWQWVPATGRGTVASWIVNHHSFGAGAGGRPAPYTVVLVRLDDQPDILIPGGWAGAPDGADLSIGLPVVAGFDDVDLGEVDDQLDTSGESDRVALLRWGAS
jgi:uncharacterized OB-fold protein